MESALSNARRAVTSDLKAGGDGRPAQHLPPIFHVIMGDVKLMMQHHRAAYTSASMYGTANFDFQRDAEQAMKAVPAAGRLGKMLDMGATLIKGLLKEICDSTRSTPFSAIQQPAYPPIHSYPPQQAYPPPMQSYHPVSYPPPPSMCPQPYMPPAQTYGGPAYSSAHVGQGRQPRTELCRNFASAKGCNRQNCRFIHDGNAIPQGGQAYPRPPQQPK